MKISQDVFNKSITVALLLYTMVMYTLSWWTSRPLDLGNFFVLVAPLLTHTIHLIDNKFADKKGNNGNAKYDNQQGSSTP